jgi:hypothetical protein
VAHDPFWLWGEAVHFGTKGNVTLAHFGRDASAGAKTWALCFSIGQMLFIFVRMRAGNIRFDLVPS